MGIFDIFTGDSAKKAAEENRRLLTENRIAGSDTLNTGQNNALGAVNDARASYQPLADLGTKYGGATSLALDALGVNGSAGNDRATAAFRAGPGYQWSVDQSLDGVARKANALGVGAGGNTLAALSDRAGNMADQEYGSWLDRLSGFVSPELSATSGAAGGRAGTDLARAGIYTDTAGKIAGLGTNTANGIANQNTQEANAVTSASGNLWNFGLQAATAAATGGTSLLGGLGGGSKLGSSLGSLGITYGNPGTAGSNLYGPVYG